MRININILSVEMKMEENGISDSFNSKIDYLRLSVTDRCNLRCKYCMPGEGIRLAGREELLTYEEILKAVKILGELGIRKLRLTGGEPLLRDDILDLVSGLSKLRILKIFPLPQMASCSKNIWSGCIGLEISSINISLDSLDEKNYSQITRGGDIKKSDRLINRSCRYRDKKSKDKCGPEQCLKNRRY